MNIGCTSVRASSLRVEMNITVPAALAGTGFRSHPRPLAGSWQSSPCARKSLAGIGLQLVELLDVLCDVRLGDVLGQFGCDRTWRNDGSADVVGFTSWRSPSDSMRTAALVAAYTALPGRTLYAATGAN